MRTGTLILLGLLGVVAIACSPCHAAKTVISPNVIQNGQAQEEINRIIAQANYGDTVIIPSGTWTISSHIRLKSGVSIEGEGTDKTTIRGTYNTCPSDSDPGYFYGNGVSNLHIAHINFDSTSAGPRENGRTQYKVCFFLRGCENIEVFDVKNEYWIYNDFMKISRSKNIALHDSWVASGHSAMYIISNSENIKAYNNDFEVHTNAGFRVDNSRNCEAYNNNIFCGAQGGGQAGVELQRNCNGLYIHHNIFYDLTKCTVADQVVQNLGATGNLRLENNVWWNCRGGVGRGVQMRDNIIDPDVRTVAFWEALGYGSGLMSGGSPSEYTGDGKNEDTISLTDLIYAVDEDSLTNTTDTSKTIYVIDGRENCEELNNQPLKPEPEVCNA